jgi:hypothetical protein
MKKKLFLITLILFFFSPLFANSVNSNVILVNNEQITEEEIYYEMGQIEMQAMLVGEQNSTPISCANTGELRNTVENILINKHLLLQECKRLNITFSSKIIDQNLQTMKDQFKTEEQFLGYLDFINITEEKLKEEIAVALKIDALATQAAQKNNRGKAVFSEEEKEQALASVLGKLLCNATIIR